MGKLKMECHEANHICDKNQYKEASFWEKVRLNIHLIYCRACRQYTARNNKLTKAYKDPRVNTVSSEEKNELQELLNKQLAEK